MWRDDMAGAFCVWLPEGAALWASRQAVGTALNESVKWEVSVGAPKSGSATRAAVRGAMQGVFGVGPPIK